MLEIRLLGGFEVKCGGQAAHISGRPEQSLFAYLALNGGVFHRREKLAALLWPDAPEESARENLRHVLWRIRKSLREHDEIEYMASTDIDVAFAESAQYWLDVSVLRAAKGCDTADALIEALSVYRGELLPGFPDEWVVLEREYLKYFYDHSMARLMAYLGAENRWLDILEWGEHWIAFGQKPEPAYRALMWAHMKKGDMSRVADTYSRCVRALGELGFEPSEQTNDMYKKIRERVPQ